MNSDENQNRRYNHLKSKKCIKIFGNSLHVIILRIIVLHFVCNTPYWIYAIYCPKFAYSSCFMELATAGEVDLCSYTI